ncbi:MAG: hypothetical protein ACJ79K_03405 [Gemmatimonadaceae bacterium]
MKKRGARDIPDFSHKQKNVQPGSAAAPRQASATAALRRDRVVKPQATSAKSGRRGQ